MLIDPICGMHMDPESAPAFATYQERTYYFCCDEHKQKFEADPERYAEIARQAFPEAYNCGQKAA
jgi:Cu+-exporting ATPase